MDHPHPRRIHTLLLQTILVVLGVLAADGVFAAQRKQAPVVQLPDGARAGDGGAALESASGKGRRSWEESTLGALTAVMSCPDALGDFETQGSISITNNIGLLINVTLDIGYRSECFAGPGDEIDADFEQPPLFLLAPGATTQILFGDLGLTTPACDSYVAFARAQGGGSTAEAYCERGGNGLVYSPSEVSASASADLVLSNDIDLEHLPLNGPSTCHQFGESLAALNNPRPQPTNQYRGIVTGQFACFTNGQICQTTQACFGLVTPGGDGLGRAFAGFELPGVSCRKFRIYEGAGGLPRCCDCADVALQCSRYIITHAQLTDLGDTEYRRVLPPLWSGVSQDFDPESRDALSPFTCGDFRATSHAEGQNAGPCTDVDFDIDGDIEKVTNPHCDSVRPSVVPPTGGTTVTAVNPKQSEQPQQVLVRSIADPTNCQYVPVTNNPDNTLTFRTPPNPPGSYRLSMVYSANQQSCVEEIDCFACRSPDPPNDILIYRQTAHLLSLDPAGASLAGVALLPEGRIDDTNAADFATPTLPLGFVPRDFAYAEEGDPAGPGVVPVRLYIVGEEQVAPGTVEGRLSLFDATGNRAVDLDPAGPGETLGLSGPGRSIDIVGDRVGYVLVDEAALGWDIDVLDLNPSDPATPLRFPAGIDYPVGHEPLRLRATPVSATVNRVFVLHHDSGCDGGMMESLRDSGGYDCRIGPECGGGSLPADKSRTLRLLVADFDDRGLLAVVANLVVDDLPSAPCSLRPLLDADMDFNAAGTELWITSPDLDRVHVVDVATAVRLATVPVGDFPTGIDLAVMDDGSLQVQEIAFVANTLGDSYTMIDVRSRVPGAPILLPAGSAPTDLVVTAEGMHLLVVESGLDQVESFALPDGSLEHQYTADAAPRRVIVPSR